MEVNMKTFNFMPQSSFVYEHMLIYFVMIFNFIKFLHVKQAKFRQFAFFNVTEVH
jgi:hypothetical protein